MAKEDKAAKYKRERDEVIALNERLRDDFRIACDKLALMSISCDNLQSENSKMKKKIEEQANSITELKELCSSVRKLLKTHEDIDDGLDWEETE